MHPDEIESFRLAPELKSSKIRGDLRCRVYALKGSRLQAVLGGNVRFIVRHLIALRLAEATER